MSKSTAFAAGAVINNIMKGKNLFIFLPKGYVYLFREMYFQEQVNVLGDTFVIK